MSEPVLNFWTDLDSSLLSLTAELIKKKTIKTQSRGKLFHWEAVWCKESLRGKILLLLLMLCCSIFYQRLD